jgi:hypothetical protein
MFINRLYIALVFTSLLQAATFEQNVLPILEANCLPCHDDQTKSSGLVVTSLRSVVTGGARLGQAVRPGKPDSSPLLEVLRGTVKPQMPPGKVLSAAQISVIEEWVRGSESEIAAVAPQSKRYWAFVRPQKPPLPAIRDVSWPRNEIDYFVLNKLEASGLRPAAEADRRTLIRRLYFDLIGLPPSPEETNAFVDDRSPEAYEQLVERLLADSRYGERWGRHWLDLARYADTNGYEGDPEWPHAWRYRDYVIDAFNHDKPYDEFIKEQIAGDELVPVESAVPPPPPQPEQEVALSFLRLAPFNRTPVSDENRDSLLSEMTSTVGSVFLGLTVGCAKCHDHKYDSIPTRDFYRMKAFFATVQIANTGRAGGSEPAEFYRPGEKEWADTSREKYTKELAGLEAMFSDFQKPLIQKLAAERKSHKEDHAAAEVTAKDVDQAINVENNNAANLEKKDEVFTHEEKEKYADFAGRITRLKKEIERLDPMAMGVRDADGPPFGPALPVTYLQIRGDYDLHGDPVEPGFLSAITGNSDPAFLEVDRYHMFPTRGRRMTLAKWIASPENPLTARVMVNRIWQHHFGRGIVETPSDFGRNGAAPTHPELLDWMATRFVEEKWTLKSMHRLIVNSSTYRQASVNLDNKASQTDPDNRLLWHFNLQRLEGEAVRDSVLAVSGRLNPKLGGLPVYPPLPLSVEQEQKVQGVDTWETSSGVDALRRSIYIFQRRAQNLPLLDTFDAPVPTSTCERRRFSITALQALSMYDSDFVNEESVHFAERVRKEAGPDPRMQIRRMFELALDRPPSPTEEKDLLDFLNSIGDRHKALTALCRVIFNTNEFLYID